MAPSRRDGLGKIAMGTSPSTLLLTTGNHADDFETVAGGELSLGPLGAQQRRAVVLDKSGGEGQAEFGDEFFRIGRRHFPRFAVEDKFHAPRMARSQSFHTGSSPSSRKRAAISCGVR